jgi:hypothetical protein
VLLPRTLPVQLRLGLLVLAPCALLLAPPALAAFSAAGIEIDGNYVDDPAPEEDWYPNYPPYADPVGADDLTLCGTSPAPKDDIAQYFLANNRDYLYLGMERLTNNGNTSFFFNFDITGDGPSLGDFIFVFCFGSGEVVTDTHVLEWNEALGDWAVDSTPPAVLFEVNHVLTLAPFGTFDEHGNPASSIDPGRFGEARITLADIEGFDVCDATDVTGEIQSKSSCSLPSECKDTSGPFHFSFVQLGLALDLSQPPACEPLIIASAHAHDGAGPIAYRWFLDGVDITSHDPSWSSSDSIEIPVLGECGPHEVRVAIDDGTCTADDTDTLNVDRRPDASITALSVGACDRVLAFDGRGSSDCNGAALTFLWDFDSDGNVDSVDASGTFTYSSCGDRVVTLRVASGDCISPPVTQSVHVNEAPVAGLQVVPSGCLGIEWASLATDCDLANGGESLAVLLDFGDGTSSSDAAGTHDYAECGSYAITLTVIDGSGCSDAESRLVTFTGVLDVQ